MAPTLTLNCLLLSQPTSYQEPFQVIINGDGSVDSLKDAIMQKKHKKLEDIDASDLRLFKIEKTEEECLALGTQMPEDAIHMRALAVVGDYFSAPKPKLIHILVQTPELTEDNGEPPRKRQRRTPIDVTVSLINTWSAPKDLPPPSQLSSLLTIPLAANEKIPLLPVDLVDLLSTKAVTADSMCTREDIEAVAHITEDNVAFLRHDLCRMIHSAYPSVGTESTFHWFWDNSIRLILETALPGLSRRDSNRGSSTGSRCPDFLFLMEGTCVLRGEEKGPAVEIKEAERELTQKLIWKYEEAPYIFAYAASGTLVKYFAITPSKELVTLGSFDLAIKRARIHHARFLIRLLPYLVRLSNILGPNRDPQPSVIQRENGYITLHGDYVTKTLTGDDAKDRFEHSQRIYSYLANKMVPHVDILRKSSSRGGQYSLHLEPEGNCPQPATEEDLCFAIKCILEALEQLHSEPDPLLHRDIRWPNIVQKRDNSAEWLLIDWEDASTFPTLPPSRSFSRETHSPRVFEAGHGTEVDLWAVGTLITTWEGGQPSESMMQLAEEMINGVIKTATDALLQFNEYMEPKIVLS